ncbi:hypothetical protein BEWA_011630 [Theileria equi strain WA]|uniref:Nuclear speckle splicing regulatory protein 1 N-terminal domain-containing protein n=1 Tax=Theileria equi strain WA TaxID=1537102 RepID=L0B1N3_THEEQ|nr:hypothetical protein BEWA_011630 [Theileria equi strain WA]AFZ81745.1 hypothetical protein BEWA_011630 [Theileria equi strain WA]|eukprot:XP_004831411.1 hypothetical protein BEWA_011630 [Theileria equi strain WA]
MKIVIKNGNKDIDTKPKKNALKVTNKTILKPNITKNVDRNLLNLAFDNSSTTDDRIEPTVRIESHQKNFNTKRLKLDEIEGKYYSDRSTKYLKNVDKELDPSLYLYDEYVDEDTVEKEATKFTYLGYSPDKIKDTNENNDNDVKNKQRTKEPQYMAKILDRARKRQIEREIALDKKLLEDELATNGAIAEVFVTGAYRKKLEERKQFELEQQKQNQFDAIHSNNGLSNFHKHLLSSGIAKRSAKGPK